MADHFSLWALAKTGADPGPDGTDFIDATTELQVLEAGKTLLYNRRFFRGEDEGPLPVGSEYVRIVGDLMHKVELSAGLYGSQRALSMPAHKFPPIEIWLFGGDVPGLTQVIQHADWYGIAAEAIGDAALPPAWADRTPGAEMTPGQAGALRTFVLAQCKAEHVDLVTSWFAHLTDKYTTGDPPRLHFTPQDFRRELVRYTS